MKKIIILLLCVVFFSGCNKKVIDNSEKYLNDLKIKDFVIEIINGKLYDDDAFFLTIKNNSSFDIIDPVVYYSIKDKEKASSIFETYINAYGFLFEAGRNVSDILLIANSKELIKSKSNSSDMLLVIGFGLENWNDIPTTEQLSMMEKSILEFKFVGTNQELYLVNYNFIDNEWKIELIDENIDLWKDKRILKDFFIPTVDYNLLNNNSLNIIEFISYDVSKDYFDKYINILKKLGYDKYSPSGTNATYYSAKNIDGKQVYIRYNSESKTMYVKVKK